MSSAANNNTNNNNFPYGKRITHTSSTVGSSSNVGSASSNSNSTSMKLGNLSPIQHYRSSNLHGTYSHSDIRGEQTKNMDEVILHNTQTLMDYNTPRGANNNDFELKSNTSPLSSTSESSAIFNKPLDQLVKCFLCFNKPSSPHLCPCCSKIVCLGCAKKWISEKSSCPNCRSPLSTSQLVNCKFVTEISSELEKLQTQIKKDKTIVPSRASLVNEHCSSHDLPLIYYCETCKEPICSDCAMFEEKHKNHKFKKVNEVYKECVDIVKVESETVKTRLKDLNSLTLSIEENIKRITKAKEETLKTINETVEEMRTNLDSLYKSKLSSLVSQKNMIIDEIAMLEKLTKELGRQIETSPQCVLISKTPDIVRVVDEINKKPTVAFNKIAVTESFPNEIVPPYEGGQFRIENYSELLKTTEVIYSDPITINGLQWRLKVYPNGTGVAKGVFISVFLEMFKGLTEPKKYHYKVEMVNKRDTSKNIERSFASIFESGECWGYNRFYRVSELAGNGFIDVDDDVLNLNFFVRPTSYFELCLEQARYIKDLEDFKKMNPITSVTTEEEVAEEANNLLKEEAFNNPNLSPIEETETYQFLVESEETIGNHQVQEQENTSLKIEEDNSFSINTQITPEADESISPTVFINPIDEDIVTIEQDTSIISSDGSQLVIEQVEEKSDNKEPSTAGSVWSKSQQEQAFSLPSVGNHSSDTVNVSISSIENSD
ncbi:predicted protein [Naegleria gruberi]|uniref:Predicted protein n=1 Tax=Naegleria gruberi TaxID=5762 RepID=D2VUH3_NAEGR|nr:uncharacterized protein NAEGRDRAFT_72663 [Naegleria gruberi]EFC39449.1 predicted protein [Naegleria gruberi]|eukprot:XP_002672193.1 predicted protein [Naegleria gruberi strain NEG-M]